MNISKAQFLSDVAHEINMLKKHGTKKELLKLNLELFDADNIQNCIYGQMTDSCGSERAKELMDKACIRVVDLSDHDDDDDLESQTFDEIKQYVNGEYDGQTWFENRCDFSNRSYAYLSALETYICLKGAKIENILSYMRGEKTKLEL